MYFDKFVSNTLAGSSNQCFFMSDGQTHKGRVFYKIFEKGEYNYSFLFTNTIDSTFSDGSVSRKNMVCGEWMIESLKVACCSGINNDIPQETFKTVTFGGEKTKKVAAADVFASDPVCLCPSEYICLELTFKGEMMPYHEELVISSFVEQNGEWVDDRRVPVPSMIGCDRKVKKQIAFMGDSITQGCGTAKDSYTHWNAVLAELTGHEYAYWNLGIGFGRASDAASDGAWLQKAKQNDTVVVCFGVNDIFQGAKEEQIRADIKNIAEKLKEAGLTVILQTVPPFDYSGENIEKWKRINTYIKTELANTVDAIFDNAPVLRKSEQEPHMTVYNAHPNAEGCRKWAEAIYGELKEIITA